MERRNAIKGLAAALGGLVAIPECDMQSNKPTDTNHINTDSLRLEQRLKELSKTEYTGELAWGAMCYKIAMPVYVDYSCPYCDDTIKEKYNNWTIYMINQIDDIVEQIKTLGYDAVLDKTEFCPNCSKKEIQNPVLIFKIRFSEEDDYHIVRSNIVNEYQCLYDFLKNPDEFTGDKTIIRKMTGLGEDLKIKKQ